MNIFLLLIINFFFLFFYVNIIVPDGVSVHLESLRNSCSARAFSTKFDGDEEPVTLLWRYIIIIDCIQDANCRAVYAAILLVQFAFEWMCTIEYGADALHRNDGMTIDLKTFNFVNTSINSPKYQERAVICYTGLHFKFIITIFIIRYLILYLCFLSKFYRRCGLQEQK